MLMQLIVSAAATKLADTAGLLQADHLEWGKIKSFLLVVVGFLGAVFANMKVEVAYCAVCLQCNNYAYCHVQVLQHSNVETFITFRSRYST